MSSNKAIVSGVTGRYAVALFDLALEGNALEAVKADLDKLSALMSECEEFSSVVTSPLLGKDDQSKAMNSVAAELKLSDTVKNFLGVLVANRRLNILSGTVAAFGRLLADHKGEIKAEVVSAKSLTKGQTDALAKKLKEITGQDVTFEMKVDENLLGGLIVKVGSQMVDSSLKTKLANLKLSMKGV